MIKSHSNKIKVHRLLRELFGLETTRFDLLAIIISAVSFAALTLILNSNSAALATKAIVLIILALDIGGGVVANFTTGTNNYYAESLQKRYLFVVFHLLQPSVLIWIFPNELLPILGVSIFTLTSSLIVLNIKKNYSQRIIAVTLLLLSLILSTILNYTDPLAQVIMQLFSVKLILAFSVNWTANDKDEKKGM
jgi:membrane glycosyltransferase